jgi:hypothetical protein
VAIIYKDSCSYSLKIHQQFTVKDSIKQISGRHFINENLFWSKNNEEFFCSSNKIFLKSGGLNFKDSFQKTGDELDLITYGILQGILALEYAFPKK